MVLHHKLKFIKTTELVLIVILVIDIVMHYKAITRPNQLPLPNVIVTRPTLRPMTEYITQTGNTVAYNSVNLVARVEGYLNDITFTDGTFIKKGHPLFVIEPEPYLEQLREAKAALRAQQAIEAYDKAEYIRQKRMFRENATSLNNVEKWLAKSQESVAEVDKAQANVAIAEINYSYTHIAAPFDGRIGRHLVDTGNLVGNGVATQLATIDQLDPIYVYFNLNEIDVLKLRKARPKEGYQTTKDKHIAVTVRLQNDSNFKYKGQLDFINTSLNASTGTLELRAILPNKDLSLVPGLFVQVRVAIAKPTPQLTVPDTAVLYDQIGSYLLVTNADNMVELKRVTLGSVENEQRAILQGIQANDRVIIDGLQFATPGHPVAPQTGKPIL